MKTTVVCILDGLGLNPDSLGNGVAAARTPTLNHLFATAPWTTLVTHGERVGLPAGQMGNSEVGHLNIGAGRVVEQWLLRITRGLQGDFLMRSAEWSRWSTVAQSAPTIHLVGLYSRGGVHSHSEHLHALLTQVHALTKAPIHLHLFTDGRDTAPTIAAEDIAQLEKLLAGFPRAKIASLSGRFFAMDRDNRWERVERAFQAMVAPTSICEQSPQEYVRAQHLAGITDEFIEPMAFAQGGVKPQDALVFFNFREDRMREICSALCQPAFAGFTRANGFCLQPERVLCFTDYDHTLHLPVLFPSVEIANHLGAVVAASGRAQLRVAETEKYPHVTYFLNGGVETPYPGEERTMIPSPRDVKTYDLKPEMSAAGVCDTVMTAIESGKYALVVVNFANCDMVGHTGVQAAVVKAVETVDQCLGRILATLATHNGQAVIFADHGNAEQLLDYQTGAPMTSHTTFPVPFWLVSPGHPKSSTGLRLDGALCDIAPTVLRIMDIQQPPEMTGRSLLAD